MSKFVFSLIIVSYNGRKYLRRCLESIFATKYQSYEVIVIDNGSTDGSIQEIRKTYKSQSLRLIELGKNFGLAKGVEEGMHKARGRIVILLNQDILVHPQWLSEIARAFNDPAVGEVQCKILELSRPKIVQSVGCYLLPNLLWPIPLPGRDLPDSGPRYRTEVLASGPALAIRRSVLEKIRDAFDPLYFVQFEDIDLCLRVRSLGKKTILAPHALVWHERHDFGKNPSRARTHEYYAMRNSLITIWKNFELRTAVVMTLITLGFFLVRALASTLLKGKVWSLWNVLRAVFWLPSHAWLIAKRRKLVQHHRKVRDKEILGPITQAAHARQTLARIGAS